MSWEERGKEKKVLIEVKTQDGFVADEPLQKKRSVDVTHSSGGSVGGGPPCAAGDPGPIPGPGRSPGEGNAAHSSDLAWRIPWTEEPGGLRFRGGEEADRTERQHRAQHTNHARGNRHRGFEGHFPGGPVAEDSACQCAEHRPDPWSGSQGPTRRGTAESRTTTTKPLRPRATRCSHAKRSRFNDSTAQNKKRAVGQFQVS